MCRCRQESGRHVLRRCNGTGLLHTEPDGRDGALWQVLCPLLDLVVRLAHARLLLLCKLCVAPPLLGGLGLFTEGWKLCQRQGKSGQEGIQLLPCMVRTVFVECPQGKDEPLWCVWMVPKYSGRRGYVGSRLEVGASMSRFPVAIVAPENVECQGTR
jgi:hypothetical protein